MVLQALSENITDLGRAITGDLLADPDDCSNPVRRSAEFASRFARRPADERIASIAPTPAPTGDPRWDAFLGALVEWLAVTYGHDAPDWVHEPDRYLHRAWWVTDAESMKAWEYAGAPMSFKLHGVYLHRDSLVNV